VVEGGAAGGVEDAAGVQLEVALVRLNGHAHRLVGHRLGGAGGMQGSQHKIVQTSALASRQSQLV